jgi:NAD(P)-dependent dehydrogenase (short-subunit alcohol dehydrogenase family)
LLSLTTLANMTSLTRLARSSDIPDQTGRVAIVTGGGSGIGLEAARALAAKGASVTLAVRDVERGRRAASTISGVARVNHLDLASLQSVRAFASTITGPVDYLINNAGTMTGSRQTTEDGFEMQLGVNYLGHFALTNLLLDRITARVVTITSTAYARAAIEFDDLQWQTRPYRPFGAYGQSKLAGLLFAAELQRRLTATGSPVLATAAHPGWAATGFTIDTGRALLDRLTAVATSLMAQGAEGGALPTLLATTGDAEPGSLAGPRRFGVRGPATFGITSPVARDSAVAARLWGVSERLTHTTFPEPATA